VAPLVRQRGLAVRRWEPGVRLVQLVLAARRGAKVDPVERPEEPASRASIRCLSSSMVRTPASTNAQAVSRCGAARTHVQALCHDFDHARRGTAARAAALLMPIVLPSPTVIASWGLVRFSVAAGARMDVRPMRNARTGLFVLAARTSVNAFQPAAGRMLTARRASCAPATAQDANTDLPANRRMMNARAMRIAGAEFAGVSVIRAPAERPVAPSMGAPSWYAAMRE
jgi:hypothetical protein